MFDVWYVRFMDKTLRMPLDRGTSWEAVCIGMLNSYPKSFLSEEEAVFIPLENKSCVINNHSQRMIPPYGGSVPGKLNFYH